MAALGIEILTNEQAHEPAPGHPENVTRLRPMAELLAAQMVEGKYIALPITSHDELAVTAVHSGRYIDVLKEACGSGGGYLDGDTYCTSTSYDAVLAVVNSVLSAVDESVANRIPRSFVLGRPPGHHAEFHRAMGFCLVNNIAIAAQYALSVCGLQRVAIVDFDVHHGNGTQHLFYDRADVLFISCHQFPFYPGTGAAQEVGTGRGLGYTVNVPLAARSGDSQIIEAFGSQILPALNRYRPELLLVSAGFDAHRLDPVGGLMFTGEAYRRMGLALREVAEAHCKGRIVSVLEGGYNPEGNVEAITHYLDGLEKT